MKLIKILSALLAILFILSAFPIAILAEGEAARRDDLIFLEKLPLFDREGNPID